MVELAQITGADLAVMSSKEPIINTNIDVNKGVERYLTVRSTADIPKRVAELRKVILDYHLEDKLSEKNRQILGITIE